MVGGHREAQVVEVGRGGARRAHHHARRYLLHHTAAGRTRGHPAQRLLPGGGRGARSQLPGRLAGREAPPAAPARPGIAGDEEPAAGRDQDGPVGGQHLQLPGVRDPPGHTGPARPVVTGTGHDEPDPADARRAQGVEEGAQPGPQVVVRRATPGGRADHHGDDVRVHAHGVGDFGQRGERERVVLDGTHQQEAVDVLDGRGADGALPPGAARGRGRIPGGTLRGGSAAPAVDGG
ncbi:hypothetical protein [Streptomyces sp. SID1121]|uniref:hypothetical protein n=1 Tax=Streptomyces sp. SID1121 TaxID=3425888 RepID=UPI004055C1E5